MAPITEIRDRLNMEWVHAAPAWIKEAREGRNANRVGLLDEPMIDACGNVSGLRVLDCGCGEGRFCRLLAARSAEHIVGLDFCEPMILAAKELKSERETYQVADVQDLGFLQNQSFDVAISYLNQCGLDDFEANTREVFRVLRTGGQFIIANLHPMGSATGRWHRAPTGTKEHVILDRYFDETERRVNLLGFNLTVFHRTLSTYTHSYLKLGFSIRAIIEPTVAEEYQKHYPELDQESRVPNFIIYILNK